MTHIKQAAGAVIISKLTQRAMFSIRAPHKSHRLTWGLWGGMLNDGESPKEGLFREVKEEMGILPEFNHVELFDVYQSHDKKFTYHTFLCIVEKEFAPWIGSENAGYCWIDLGIWPKPMHYGAKKTLCAEPSLNKIKEILERSGTESRQL